MKSKWPLLVRIFRQERLLGQLQLAEWNLVISQARQSQVLGKLYYLAEAQQVLNSLPSAVLRHLQSACMRADKQFRDFSWEVVNLKEAFSNCNYPLVFLKGGGYALARLPAYKGRLFSDIDLIVPIEAMADAESRLVSNGRLGAKQDSYDQRYYRQWMHEIPPLRHVIRGSVVDLHHNILPRTASACPDARLLLEAAVDIDADLKVLSPLDRVIHSATHLFYEGELEHGLRDLLDLYDLIAGLDRLSRLALVDRAAELGLQIPVYFALRYLKLILNMSGLEAPMQKMADDGFSIPGIAILDALFCRALMPDHASCDDRWTSFARWVLYIRAHWLRMPWYMLIPHLSRKAWMKITGRQQH
ncbi:MAG: nucleotidyltransferase family protein [Methylomonas sp.]|nr:nucleotidyltransferase family protein [Methylomonas sp.]